MKNFASAVNPCIFKVTCHQGVSAYGLNIPLYHRKYEYLSEADILFIDRNSFEENKIVAHNSWL